jgi:transcription elongation factor Elf1
MHKEILYHFTCLFCKMWWSIACSDDWSPTQSELFCPHCGKKQK